MVNFSLSEWVIANTALSLYSEQTFLKSVEARVIAIATSFFTAVDTAIHLFASAYKMGHLSLRKMGISYLSPAPTFGEVTHHGKQAVKFLLLSLVGSIAAPLYPNFLKKCRVGVYRQGLGELSECVQDLLSKVFCPKEFEKVWNKAGIKDKSSFCHHDQFPLQKNDTIHQIVYRRVSQKGLNTNIEQSKPAFYHATTRAGLKGILNSGKLEVRHEKKFRGAFVSNVPEINYGKYIIVFKRSIERMSALNHGFSLEDGTYWAGFSKDIPIKESTVKTVYVPTEEDKSSLKSFLPENSSITIEVKTNFYQVKSVEIIPKEWPDKDEQQGAILAAFSHAKKVKSIPRVAISV